MTGNRCFQEANNRRCAPLIRYLLPGNIKESIIPRYSFIIQN